MVLFNELSCYKQNYNAQIKSRAHFLTPEARETVGEFFSANIHTFFADLLGLTIIVESDVARHYESVTAGEPDNDNHSWPAAGYRQFRHNFEIVAQQGLMGTFFTVTIIKKIPDTGEYQHFGTDIEIMPCPEYTNEFALGMSPLGSNY